MYFAAVNRRDERLASGNLRINPSSLEIAVTLQWLHTDLKPDLIPLMTNGFMAEEALWNLKLVRALKCGKRRFIMGLSGAALYKGEEKLFEK